jgi:NADH dehydrogenase (ubiquinone) Fe-S protein 1
MYLLNADDLPASRIPKNAFVVYQGHHGDAGASFADVILPGAAYTEKTATYVNTEGRAQLSRSAVSPPAGTREDWKILRALSQVCGVPLKYDEISELRVRMHHVSPTLVDFDRLLPTSTLGLGLAALKTAGAGKKLGSAPLTLPIQDFYQTDPISRASRTMAKCSTAFTKGEELVPESAVFQAT